MREVPAVIPVGILRIKATPRLCSLLPGFYKNLHPVHFNLHAVQFIRDWV